MRPIEPQEAKDVHKVWTAHHEMSPGGELRFRLSSADGTRYIRTVRPAGSGGEWQDAHYHRSVLETYIVQAGWIAFVEETDGQPRARRLEPGEIVTTQPGVHHNVYMADGAVIHTVKHGIADGEDKEPAPSLTQWCKQFSTELMVVGLTAKPIQNLQATRKPIYDEAYRHFDSLIWQMPGWSTAIFLGTAAVLGQASVQNLQSLLPAFTTSSLTTGFLFVIFAFMLGLTQALYRFRVHQAPLKSYSRTPLLASASTQLQLFVTAQAFVVLYLAISSAGTPLIGAFIGCLTGYIALASYREWALRNLPLAPRAA
ncbi:MAG: cupin domain-containing protein [Vitreoscilla sp.]|nr:cupin domain-containing protein [Vitreoscilla sp.]